MQTFLGLAGLLLAIRFYLGGWPGSRSSEAKPGVAGGMRAMAQFPADRPEEGHSGGGDQWADESAQPAALPQIELACSRPVSQTQFVCGADGRIRLRLSGIGRRQCPGHRLGEV